MSSTHACPAPGCENRVPRSQLACRSHWYALPADLRSAVWDAYNHHGPGSDEHGEAIGAAIEWLDAHYGGR